MSNTTIGICAIKHEGADVADPYEDVGVIIEGIQVLDNLDNVANACSMMVGLIYALNLYFMQLDANKLSNKVQVLKNKLLS
uniref:Uncharacterized protein n=1 Tax=Paramormyrops kingsleyae TaxID=1676925 RepID=A0A3B3S609_9TELE